MVVGAGLAAARNREQKPRYRLILRKECGILVGV